MKVFSFFGSSSSGKTTVIETLIRTLRDKYKIAYIKNIPHDNLDLDTQGKDTWRAENAGSYETIALSPTRTYRLTRKRSDIDEILASLDSDIVFIEGFGGYARSIKFLVIGDESFLRFSHDFVIRANNSTYSGDAIIFPEEASRIADIIEGRASS
ncbi:molybdopterin-guanine dinucleotide biosynthesis protein B [Thermoplasma sp.]|uniref:molybdopterin-guanine dinucleotide biosynthesis protein B n=1 Tax=Thermoplasma sp. TaxID=1973142 RepID=UPI0012707481|nr:molybdopterin-guanine dinucleotide biosynthesis protein B [Thermoplasma sp.]KAA8922383.1 MAG: molybdopterin-guanine dinucleotide biosynthesis protein B [Thermoplasma sp.]